MQTDPNVLLGVKPTHVHGSKLQREGNARTQTVYIAQLALMCGPYDTR